jgi:beta-mannanase
MVVIRGGHSRARRGLVIALAAGTLMMAAPLGAVGAVTTRPAALPAAPATSTLPETYSVLGQPALTDTTLATRCAGADAHFSYSDEFGEQYGPSGIVVAPDGRLFVTDYGGHRVLSWPSADALGACEPADMVIGAKSLDGPEALALDPAGNLYVADTVSQTVQIFAPKKAGYTLSVTLGQHDTPGDTMSTFHYPLGLAISPTGQLFVADDANNRILIFQGPFTNGMSADDSISAGDNGGLDSTKTVAVLGDSLFVGDYNGNRVLRFTGPFATPDSVYQATAIFTGVVNPVDMGIGPNGSLYVDEQEIASGTPKVAVYTDAALSPSVSAPEEVITPPVAQQPLGIAIDRSGRLFISDYEDYRVLITGPAAALAPADVRATPATATLLSYLAARANQPGGSHQVIIGQAIPTFDDGTITQNPGWYSPFSDLTKQRLPLPDLMDSESSFLSNGKNPAALKEMVTFAQDGGIAELDWHPNNPVAGGSYSTPDSTSQLESIVQSGTPAHTKWMTQLKGIAKVIGAFATTGVPVLFRPLVEMNGRFFWWGDNGGSGAALSQREVVFAALWHQMFDYLTQTEGLHDILWVYAVNDVGYGCCADAMDYYPGSNEVDITGVDDYNNNLYIDGNDPGVFTYNEMVATAKPWGLTEAGQSSTTTGTGTGANWDAETVLERLAQFPAMAFANYWYSSYSTTTGANTTYLQLSDLADTSALLHDPRVVTLSGS